MNNMLDEIVNYPLPWSSETEKLFEQDLTKDFVWNENSINAKVIADSVNSINNKRIITLQLTQPRIVLAETNTHRICSKNTQSSRAVPAKKMRANIFENMFVPTYWGANKSGMSADHQLDGWRLATAKCVWKVAGITNAFFHYMMEKIGVHKQICNRLIEPYMSVFTIITSTEWDNFLKLRYNKNAQPEMIILAKCIHDAIKASTPRIVGPDSAHLPYITDQEIHTHSLEQCIKTSVARCCRVSYKSRETGKLSNFNKDLELFNRLFHDHHMSPFEHIAFVPNDGRIGKEKHIELQRNLRGWYQFRAFVEPTTNLDLLEKQYNIHFDI